ncbi:ABC transporter ATP-binding protein [Alteribacter natronophilus]|uniref:ABC transporter ATP-binding protein n=1 Tax=Alteribacter natronophilus TaxID=2583810 RepID=UPI00110DD352|nr:ABC transporter ATP-binding protein [Alteribacter natronophilus]TMW70290.1 energy-coupling factor ABC transporter ATP-binding protein [Alteribacter natronophilus]
MKRNQRKDDIQPLVDVSSFSFGFEEKEAPVLNDLSFNIQRGETVLLMGPSGSGKSTLALCLNRLYPAAVEGWTKGTIRFKGSDTASYRDGELNQQIGVVFQDPESQFCMITVENELAFTLENLHTPRGEMDGRMEEVLEATGMTEYRYRNIHELSGGEKQKIALASVLLLNPDLLILDEPTANLDPASRKMFIDLISRLKEDWNMSVLVIEHQLDDWVEQTDRVLAVNSEGRLFLEGAPDSVFYDRFQELKAEGIHLPKVVKTAVENGIPGRPLSEADLVSGRVPDPAASEHKSPAMPGSSGTILSLNQVAFSRKKKSVLKDVSLEIRQGEFLAIAGENGAGKSTLLQLMAGLLKPSSGSRTFLDKAFEKWDEKDLRRQLGFVFQNPEHQFITDTVYDEITFGMKLNGAGEPVMEQRAKELMTKFHLSGKKYSNPFSLSGGQKRRLSVASMLDDTPELLLFDEPTFGQDARTTDELMKIISSLQQSGTAVVFVTHDMDLVDRYCERVCVISSGTIAFSGSPDKLWNRPDLVAGARLRLPFRARIQQAVKGEKPHAVVR